jgi:hypothetical protein
VAEIVRGGPGNPLIKVSRDEVAGWLRQIVDGLGYGDRRISTIQINVEHEFVAGKNYHWECPELIVMVSNIPDSPPASAAHNSNNRETP